jgi:hypothetical protein
MATTAPHNLTLGFLQKLLAGTEPSVRISSFEVSVHTRLDNVYRFQSYWTKHFKFRYRPLRHVNPLNPSGNYMCRLL